MQYQLKLGDCLEVLRTLPDNSVDAIVTDPPYGLSFMGRKWDYDVPSIEVWAECLRVLKPGGHMLAFAGTRTQHRMACRIEDAGFEIRDMIAWVYGSGFPKSLDVSKAIDKAAGAEREVLSEGKAVKRMIPGADQSATGSWIKDNGREYVPTVTAPATDTAAQWEGWGTALKPALEPITVARKPLIGTVAANVLEHGTGALNIDGCRVGWPDGKVPEIGTPGWGGPAKKLTAVPGQEGETVERSQPNSAGRWPANLIHDGSDEVVAQFPHSTSGAMKSGTRRAAQDGPGSVCYGTFGGNITGSDIAASSGSAARFFYCAKASRADRNEGTASGSTPAVGPNATMREREQADWPARNGNHHPTVKPTDLMTYLCRLVRVHSSGKVELINCSDADEAARIFWSAVERMGLKLSAPEAAPAAVAVPDERAAFEIWWSTPHLWSHGHKEAQWAAWQVRAALAATPAAMERTCGVCGADEAFTGTCGGGRVNPTALCFEGAVATAIPAAAAPVVLPEPVGEAINVFKDREIVEAEWFGKPPTLGTKLYTEQQLRALLATATGLPAQAVAYIDSEVLTSFLSSSNYRPEDGWDCHIRHQENKRDTDVPLYSRPQAQADARDAESDYQRGYRHGYNRRDAEVQGALL